MQKRSENQQGSRGLWGCKNANKFTNEPQAYEVEGQFTLSFGHFADFKFAEICHMK